jgi:hypothetical protein
MTYLFKYSRFSGLGKNYQAIIRQIKSSTDKVKENQLKTDLKRDKIKKKQDELKKRQKNSMRSGKDYKLN